MTDPHITDIITDIDTSAEARHRAIGITQFTVMVGRSQGKWIGTCVDIDIAVTMDTEAWMRRVIRHAIVTTLGRTIYPDQITYIKTKP